MTGSGPPNQSHGMGQGVQQSQQRAQRWLRMGEHVLDGEAAQSLQEPRPQVTLLMVSELGL